MTLTASSPSSASSATSSQIASLLSSYVSSNPKAQPQVKEAISVLQQFQSLYEKDPCDVPVCKTLLSKLKLLIAQFPSSSPACPVSSLDSTELLVGRETLEYAALLSLRNRDTSAFERHVAQLNTYYQDFSQRLPSSDRQFSILGLFLLHLLAQNRIGEFHMILELIPGSDWRQSKYISHPVTLEHHLMDGNYKKVFEARGSVPSPMYSYLMDSLVETCRLKICGCLEAAYEKVPVKYAMELLFLDTVQELVEFTKSVNDRKKADDESDVEWRMEGQTLRFLAVCSEKAEIPSIELLHNTIGYATELERIV